MISFGVPNLVQSEPLSREIQHIINQRRGVQLIRHYSYKVVDSVVNYNFCVDYVNIRDYLKNQNFKFEIWEHKTIFWNSKQFQIKKFKYKIEDNIELYNFSINFVFI